MARVEKRTPDSDGEDCGPPLAKRAALAPELEDCHHEGDTLLGCMLAKERPWKQFSELERVLGMLQHPVELDLLFAGAAAANNVVLLKHPMTFSSALRLLSARDGEVLLTDHTLELRYLARTQPSIFEDLFDKKIAGAVRSIREALRREDDVGRDPVSARLQAHALEHNAFRIMASLALSGADVSDFESVRVLGEDAPPIGS
jgi:hypothetical protein